jgi:hypothetical protein
VVHALQIISQQLKKFRTNEENPEISEENHKDY